VFVSKKAVISFVPLTVTLQTLEEFPRQPEPTQPIKIEPEAGVAVKLIGVSSSKTSEQSFPQLISEPELETFPEPVPDFLIVILIGSVRTVT
jgi:hypothetical protein